MLIGVYYSGPGGVSAARALADALRAEGERVQLRDADAWRADSVERFDRVVLVPSATDTSALRAAYQHISLIEAASFDEYRGAGKFSAPTRKHRQR